MLMNLKTIDAEVHVYYIHIKLPEQRNVYCM